MQYILILISMQKTRISTILREELIRAMVFGSALLVIILSTGVMIANAANG